MTTEHPGGEALPPAEKVGPFKLIGGPAAYVAGSGWPASAAIAATLGIVIASMAAGLAASLAAAPSDAGGATDRAWPFVAALLSSQIVAIVLTLLSSGAYGGRRRDVLALRRPAQGLGVVLVAFGLMLVLFGAYSLAVWLFDPAIIAKDLQPFSALMRSGAWWLALLAIALGAPLMEELLFRGFLLSALARSPIGFAGASVVTSAAWTALHASYSLAGLIEVFAVGLYFSWLLWRTGSLLVPMLCHGFYNAGVAALLMLELVPSPATGAGG